MPSSEEINSQDSVLSQASVTAIQQRFHNWPSVRDVSPQVTKPLRTDIEEGCCLNVNISLLWSYSKEFSSMWICECWEQFSSSPGGDFHRVILFEAFTNNNCSRLGTPALCLWGWGNLTGHLHPSVQVRRHWPEMSFTMYKYRLQVRCENFRLESSSITSYKISKDPGS
jgi:hypothetical protein